MHKRTLSQKSMKDILLHATKHLDELKPSGEILYTDSGATLIVKLSKFKPQELVKKNQSRVHELLKHSIPEKLMNSVSKKLSEEERSKRKHRVAKLLKYDEETGLPLPGQSDRISEKLGYDYWEVAGYISHITRVLKES